MKQQPELPDCGVALRELYRRQVRAVVFLVIRIVACALLLTLIKPLWGTRPWLSNVLFGLGGLLCGVPLLRAVGYNWRWRIALGQAYVKVGRDEDASRVLKPLESLQGQLFDPGGHGRSAFQRLQKKNEGMTEQ